jgi:hypothetical protein
MDEQQRPHPHPAVDLYLPNLPRLWVVPSTMPLHHAMKRHLQLGTSGNQPKTTPE